MKGRSKERKENTVKKNRENKKREKGTREI